MRIKHRILNQLRHGALNHLELAAELHEAPFRIRAELKGLKRDRLVFDRIAPEGHLWQLTDRGERFVYQTDQLTIGETR